jgi:hypothetical protein
MLLLMEKKKKIMDEACAEQVPLFINEYLQIPDSK